MASKENDFIFECLAKLEHTGTPPPMFSKFLTELDKSNIMTKITSGRDLKLILSTSEDSCHINIKNEHSYLLSITVNSTLKINEFKFEYNSFYIRVANLELLKELVVHLGCWASSLLTLENISTLKFDINNNDFSRLLTKTIIPTIYTKKLLLDSFVSSSFNLVISSIDLSQFTDIFISRIDLPLLKQHLGKFTSLNTIIINVGNYVTEDDIISLLETNILYLGVSFKRREANSPRFLEILNRLSETNPISDIAYTYDRYERRDYIGTVTFTNNSWEVDKGLK
jgi:hypothetical protein